MRLALVLEAVTVRSPSVSTDCYCTHSAHDPRQDVYASRPTAPHISSTPPHTPKPPLSSSPCRGKSGSTEKRGTSVAELADCLTAHHFTPLWCIHSHALHASSTTHNRFPCPATYADSMHWRYSTAVPHDPATSTLQCSPKRSKHNAVAAQPAPIIGRTCTRMHGRRTHKQMHPLCTPCLMAAVVATRDLRWGQARPPPGRIGGGTSPPDQLIAREAIYAEASVK